MRILLVTTSYPRFPGDAAGLFVADAADALVARGHDVRVIAPACAGTASVSSGVRVLRVDAPGVRKLCYGGGIAETLARHPIRFLAVPFLIHAMRRAVMRESADVDVIHAHWSVCGWMAAAAARRRGRPLFITLHGSDLHARLPLLRWMTGRAFAAADGILAASEELVSRAVARGADAARTRLLPNGVAAAAPPPTPEERRRTRAAFGLPESVPLLLFVGRLVGVKQAHLALAAFADARAQGVNAFLALVGDGPGRTELEQMAQAAGLGAAVSFLGERPHGEVRALMRAADALVLTSAWEARSMVVQEALSEGLPVVAHAVGGVPELVDDGVTGLLVDPHGAGPSCGEALRRMLTDGAFRERCAQASRAACAGKILSWAEHARRLEAIYEPVVQR